MVTIIAPKLAYYDLRAMSDDGKRYELIDGEVFMTHLQTGGIRRSWASSTDRMYDLTFEPVERTIGIRILPF